MKSILDPTFRYTKAIDTDIAKTFARVRKAQREAAKAAEQKSSSVLTLTNRTAATETRKK